MATTFPKNVRFSARAQEFYSQVFAKTFESLQNASCHTPLVVMLWGPRLRSRDWSRRRMQIREALEQEGHTVFFSEQLGIPVTATAKKGVEFLQSETTDLIVVMQPLYGLVGSVRHFVELRVVDAKMLLFIDEAAADQHLFARALGEMQAKYNNIRTFKSSEDVSQTTLLNQIIDLVRVIQMVKYRAIQSGRDWGIGAENHVLTSALPPTAAQPFRHNLLELYRAHRAEIDVLTDPLRLFLLAFVNHVEKLGSEELTHHVGQASENLAQEIKQLLNADLLMWTDGLLQVSAIGHHILDAAGLGTPAPLVRVTIARPMSWKRTAAWSTAAGVGLAAVILASMWILNGANISQSKQPLQLSPAPTLVAPIRTPTPTLPATPTPAPGVTAATPTR